MQTQNFYKIIFQKVFTTAAVLILSAAVSVSAQTTAEIDAVVQKHVESKAIPGAAVAVVRDGKVVLTKGYGAANVETKVAADENTIYEIGSVTKQMTAAGILLLVEDGKLKLDDPLGKYLTDAPENWRAVTIRQLLNQVSGVKNYTATGKIVLEKEYAPTEILKMVSDAPLEFAPGTKWQYSNTNYFLLGLIIEKVSGKTYADYMRERIFEPLGMNSTRVNTNGLKIENKALGYSPAAGGWRAQEPAHPSQPFAAGAVVSSAADMARWALALEGEKLLKRSSLDETWTAAKLADGKPTNYGFAWQVAKIGETDFVGHNGAIPGFTAYIARFPQDKLSVVVLVNGAGRMMEKLTFDIAGLYLPKVAAAVAERDKKANEAIADGDAATTKFLRETLEKLAAGGEVKDRFSAEAQASLFPDKAKQLQGLLANFGELKSFELMADEALAQGKRRSYRAAFANAKVRFTFVVTLDGKIGGVLLRPE